MAYLWLQQKIRDGCLRIVNVSGKVNLGDVFTKHVPAISMVDRIESDACLKFADPLKKEPCKLISFQKFCDKRFLFLLGIMDQPLLSAAPFPLSTMSGSQSHLKKSLKRLQRSSDTPIQPSVDFHGYDDKEWFQTRIET